MNKTKLMTQVKNKFGGEYTKDNGRWYWLNNNEKTLVTGGWLLQKLSEQQSKPEPIVQSEPVVVTEQEETPKPKKPAPKKKKEPEVQ